MDETRSTLVAQRRRTSSTGGRSAKACFTRCPSKRLPHSMVHRPASSTWRKSRFRIMLRVETSYSVANSKAAINEGFMVGECCWSEGFGARVSSAGSVAQCCHSYWSSYRRSGDEHVRHVLVIPQRLPVRSEVAERLRVESKESRDRNELAQSCPYFPGRVAENARADREALVPHHNLERKKRFQPTANAIAVGILPRHCGIWLPRRVPRSGRGSRLETDRYYIDLRARKECPPRPQTSPRFRCPEARQSVGTSTS